MNFYPIKVDWLFLFLPACLRSLKNSHMIAPLDAGWSSLAARRAHNPKVVGSNPAPATSLLTPSWGFFMIIERMKASTLMHSQQKWQAIIGPLLQGTSFELVGVECMGSGKHRVVRIYIDKPGGIMLEDIVALTRKLNVVLDVEAPIEGPYTLEVSSPGIARPLFTPDHFKQYTGREVKIKVEASGAGKRQHFKGLLSEADEDGIQIKVEEECFSFTYAQIENAKIVG